MAATLHAQFVPDNFRSDRYWQGDFQHHSRKRTGVQWTPDCKEQLPNNIKISVRMREDLRVQPALQELQHRKKPAPGQVQRPITGVNTVQTHLITDELIAFDNRDVHRRRATKVLHASGYRKLTAQQNGLLPHQANRQLDAEDCVWEGNYWKGADF